MESIIEKFKSFFMMITLLPLLAFMSCDIANIHQVPPLPEASLVQLEAGTYNSFIIKANGTLWACGYNCLGQIGDGTKVDRDVFVQIGEDTNWNKVSNRNYHTAAIKSDGSLWTWGAGSYGEIGDGKSGYLGDGVTLHSSLLPYRVGIDNKWTDVASGGYFTVGLKTDGTLWAWGRNQYGQLGDGSKENKAVPTRIGADTDWTAITAGESHTIALKKDGTIWSWGDGAEGQLGQGSQIDPQFGSYYLTSIVPRQIGTDADWKYVTAGVTTTIALKYDQTLWVWGKACNDNGKPLQIPGEMWSTVSTGYDGQTAAITSNYELYLFNYAGFEEIGVSQNPNLPKKSREILVISGTDWVQVERGAGQTLGVKTDGTIWTWGQNDYGKLGIGSKLKTVDNPTQILK